MGNDDHQVVRCQCGAKLRVPAAAVGRKVACPKCGFKILIGAPAGASSSTPKPAAAIPPPPPPSDEESLFDDLMSAEASAETTAGPDLSAFQKSCPNCKAQMTKDARVCLACGHDPLIAPAPKVGGVAGKVSKLAAGTGRFGIGCALSAAGALLAAGVWYGVAIKTGFEIGYIAWGVGLLAGLGMKIGYGQENMRGALAAVTMAAFGILAAKGMIYKDMTSFLSNLINVTQTPVTEVLVRENLRCGHEDDVLGLSPWANERKPCDDAVDRYVDLSDDELAEERQEIDQWYYTDRWANPEYAKTRLAYLYVDDMPAYGDDVDMDDEQWEWDQRLAEQDWQRRYKTATGRVEAMPEDQWVQEAKAVEIRQAEELERDMAEFKEMLSVGSSSFFSSMFGPIDAIFILLALGTAIKLGGGQDE